MAAERLVKEYIEGPTIFEMVCDGLSVEPWFRQVREMAEKARAAGINLDYFSPNFVVQTNMISKKEQKILWMHSKIEW